MVQSLSQVGLFLFLIVLGNRLKHIGMFHAKEAKTLSKIALNVTLPAAIVASFNTFSMDYSLLILIFYGIIANLVLMGFSYFVNRKQDNAIRTYALFNGSTYNVGNFSFPFVQALFGPSALVASSLFDLGNALMTTGFIYSLGSSIAGGQRPSVKDLSKKLFTSVPFIAYLVMITLSFASIRLPSFLQEWMQAIGKANPIIAMLMVGFMLEIRFERSWMHHTLRLLSIRYGMAILFSYYFYSFTAFSPVIKTALILAVFAPVSSISVAYTEQVTDQGRLSSFTSSLSVIISIACYAFLAPLLA